MQIANKKDVFGESPYRDIAGYGIWAHRSRGSDLMSHHHDLCNTCCRSTCTCEEGTRPAKRYEPDGRTEAGGVRDLVSSGASRGIRDLYGDCLQEKAKAMGLIVQVTVTEACGEDCACAEYADFPQECLRLADGVFELVSGRRRDD